MNTILLRAGRLVKRPLHTLSYLRHYDKSQSSIIFIAGLPKSGTTWLARMFSSVPGYRMTTPWHITQTDHSLRESSFKEFAHQLVVLRLHLAWSRDDDHILRYNKQKHIVIYRDLRDVAVSWYHYVAEVNKKHFLHSRVRELSLHEGIDYFIDNSLKWYVKWIRDWRRHRHPMLSTETSYETLRQDTFPEFKRLVQFFNLNLPDEEMCEIVESHAFHQVTGRRPGEEASDSHQRKGVIGDWRNVFLPRHVEAYKRLVGPLLIELGYEDDLDW